MEHHGEHQKTSEDNLVEYLKFAGVLVVIFVLSYIMYSWLDLVGWMDWMRMFMGVFLIIFSTFKFAGYEMFVVMFRGYDLIAKKYKEYSYAYPFIELALGIAFLFDILPAFRNVAVFVIMSVGAVGVFQEIYHRRSGIYCACLGNIIKLPLSTVSIVENVTMSSMALIMIVSNL